MTVYPSLSDALAVHAELIRRFGGAHGLRDQTALESALARPQVGYYTDLIQEAAALWESLSQNHPFLDGNKRLAVTLTVVFLRLNGVEVRFVDRDAFDFLTHLYETGSLKMAALDQWLRDHIAK